MASDISEGEDHGINDPWSSEDDMDDLDNCYRQSSLSDTEILASSRDMNSAIAALSSKYDEEALKVANEADRRKRREAKEQEDAWWTESRFLLTELYFEYLAEAPLTQCECLSTPMQVLAIGIQGIIIH